MNECIDKEENNIKSFSEKFSNEKRKVLLLKFIYVCNINKAIKSCKIRKGANLYAMEYLKLHPNEFVRIKDVQQYCNERHQQKTGEPLGDPPRAFEMLRKNKLPSEWSEKYDEKNNKYVKYAPHLKSKICTEILDTHKHKSDSFSNDIIEEKLKLSNYKCCITGIPQDNGGLAADHFIPKEKGGESVANNCIIINKILNEKKNKKFPIEWFCETLLTNFMTICKNVGILEECKNKLIKFIQDF